MKPSFCNHITIGSKPPLAWLALAILFTISMFFWLGWHVHHSYFIIENLQHIYINEDYQWHKVVDLSRQISAAARAVAINLDAAQLDQYRKRVAEFDTLFQEKNTSQFENKDSIKSLAEARSAWNILRTIEESALNQIRSGQREIGLSRLFDEDYKRQEQLFMNAMNDFVDQSRHRLIDQLQNEKVEEIKSLWVAFFIFIISVSFWMILIRRLQRWGGILSREILEHRQAEEAAHTSERKYKNLFEHANDPIFIIDPTTYCLLDINRKAIDFLGYDRDELLGLELRDLIFEDTKNHEYQILKKLCSSENTVSECTYRHKNGSLIPAEISGRLINDGMKEVFQCFVRDITERKRFQDERLHAQKIEAIGQVADGIAHDFKNALTAISGYSALCVTLLPERHPALESLKRIDQVISLVDDLIKAMLMFSRKQEAERQSIELTELVKNSADLFRRVLPAAITLKIDVARVQNLWVSADISQLQQTLLNLIINARDAMPNGGTLGISLSSVQADPDNMSGSVKSTGWVRLQVSDTGIGMTPEVQARIFEPFFTTKPGEYGTGLGLPMVHRIVSQHGGRLEVQSVVGQGSTFTVILPAGSPNSMQHDPEPSLSWSNGDGEMILLAEDHRYVREIMASTLQHLGYKVLQVEDGLALLDSYHAHRDCLRLLIVDLGLPKCSGLDSLRQLRAQDVHLPAILITGTDSPDLPDQLDAETLLLLKPFQMATLARLVSSLLAKGDCIHDQTDFDYPG